MVFLVPQQQQQQQLPQPQQPQQQQQQQQQQNEPTRERDELISRQRKLQLRIDELQQTMKTQHDALTAEKRQLVPFVVALAVAVVVVVVVVVVVALAETSCARVVNPATRRVTKPNVAVVVAPVDPATCCRW